MTPLHVHDVCLTAGTVMAACGAGMQWGLPVGLMVGGTLLIVLTRVVLRSA